MRQALRAGVTLPDLLPKLIPWVKDLGGPVSFILRHDSAVLKPRVTGVSDPRMFPVPVRPPQKGRRRERAGLRPHRD